MKTLLAWLLAAGVAMAVPGLDSPQAIGPFLNNVLPTTTPGPTGSWSVADAIPNLTFIDPVRITKDPLDADHAYVVCRGGEIWRIRFSSDATSADKVRVLDLRAVTWGFQDAGMMSVSFHPEFGVPGSPNRGYAYVFYQYRPWSVGNYSSAPSYMRLSRFTVPDGQVAFDPASEFVMINQFDRHNWHNGGQTFFGSDGFLYLALGDEGGANDPYDNGQVIDRSLFAGILRIDVDMDAARSHPIRRQPAQPAAGSLPSGWTEGSYTQGYFIPNDNPWLAADGSLLEEFWTTGMRSPHSMHYDDETGEVWIAEVGQGTREEITIARRAGNHQWPYMEGLSPGPKNQPDPIVGVEVPPIYDYGRGMGGCVIGGIIYRGETHLGSLGGKYIFGDHNTRALYALTRDGSTVGIEYLTSVNRSGGTKRGLAGICEGPDGEVYFLELGNTGTDTGKILKLVRDGTPVADPPQLLSQTGAFSDLATLTPAPGLIPYDVNSPLWSDGTLKGRWIAVPNDGTHDTASEQVIYQESGAFEFPVGTVLVKHFALPVDETDPSVIVPVETRFFVNGTDGSWYGVTYRWNEEGTDATLLTDGETRDLTIHESGGGTHVQRWDFPSRADCRVCHTMNADNVLGPRSHQLNGDSFYPATGRTANQLETWDSLGIFGGSFGPRDPAALPRSVDPHDPHASLDHRVRSYLDANCSHCHHPEGVTANFNARFDVPLAEQGIINGLINRPWESANERVVKPGDPLLSLMHVRMSRVGGGQMPPLAKNVVDVAAADLLEDWIRSLDDATFAPPAGANQTPVAVNDGGDASHGTESPVDVIANDSDADAPPGIHGVAIVAPPQHGTVRISGTTKRILYTHDGSTARTDSFAYTLTDPYGATSAPATVSITIPYDFAAWSAETPGTDGSPGSNGDGDLSTDLMEFALGGAPDDGASPARGNVWIEADGGDVAILCKRPEGLSGLSYVVEAGPAPGSLSEVGELVVDSSDGGIETLKLDGLSSLPGLTADAGFARLKVKLDGSSDHAVTLPFGWLGTDFDGSRTFGSPFRDDPWFSSAVPSTAGLRLSVHGTPPAEAVGGFVEVIEGPHAGHRFAVAAVSPGAIDLSAGGPHTLDPPPDLTGERIVLCSHDTIGSLFDKDLFAGSTNPAAADQIQIYENDGVSPGRFELYYLLDARPGNPTHQWRAFLPGGGDQGGRVIAPGQGVFVKRPAGATPIHTVFTGQVRANDFVRPLFEGVNLVAPPFPLPASPRDLGLLDPSAGFTASTNLNAADQFLLYQFNLFRIFYLLDHPSEPDYWREAVPASPNANDLLLFHPDEGVFLKRSSAAAEFTVPSPWTP